MPGHRTVVAQAPSWTNIDTKRESGINHSLIEQQHAAATIRRFYIDHHWSNVFKVKAIS